MLEIDRFNLWYGQKQALYNIAMAIPEHKVTALDRPLGLRQIDAYCAA